MNNQNKIIYWILLIALGITVVCVGFAIYDDWQKDQMLKKKFKVRTKDYLAAANASAPHNHTQADKALAHFQRDEHLQRCGNDNDLPKFNPELYNDPRFERYNNCYFYAFSDLNKTMKSKPQPGVFRHLKKLSKENLTCPNIMARVKADHPKVIFLNDMMEACPCGYYKAALIVTGDDEMSADKRDYHFLKQDSNFFWSHKPGSSPVTNVDASGDFIIDPKKADFDYSAEGGINYTQFCTYICVPNEENTVFETKEHQAPVDWESSLAEDYVTPPQSWSN